VTTRHNDADLREAVRARIRDAFPDFVYSGPITPADGRTGEDYDEPEALYNELHGKSWLQISAPFLHGNAHGLVLLTVEAFNAYLPAWLLEGLTDPEVGEIMVYTFCPEDGKDRHRMDRRLERMNSGQKEALSAFLTLYYKTSASKFVKDRAERAVAYVSRFR
jgi:hypothetical protein